MSTIITKNEEMENIINIASNLVGNGYPSIIYGIFIGLFFTFRSSTWHEKNSDIGIKTKALG